MNESGLKSNPVRRHRVPLPHILNLLLAVCLGVCATSLRPVPLSF
jgi:hypothetical protein